MQKLIQIRNRSFWSVFFLVIGIFWTLVLIERVISQNATLINVFNAVAPILFAQGLRAQKSVKR